MRTHALVLLPLAVTVLSPALTPAARAQEPLRPPHELVDEGRRALDAGDYAAALEAFARAAEQKPDALELAYNQGVALYRLGDYAQAADCFARALSADRPELEARARFNLGNCDYAEALQQRQTDAQAAIERLQSALENYAAVLERNPADDAARANAERAQRLIDLLRAQLEQQEQPQQDQQQAQQQDEQPQEEQDPQNQDQQRQSGDQEQRNDSPERDPNQPPQDRSEQQPQPDPQQNEQPDEQRQQADRQDQGQQEEPNDAQQPEQRPQARQPDPDRPDEARQPEQDRQETGEREQERQENAENEQPSPEQRQDAPPPQDSQQNPPDEPSGESQPDQPNAPSGQEQPGEPGDADDATAAPNAAPPAEGEAESDGQPLQVRRLSREQAARLLQMIRDKERQRRLELARREQARQAPVRKDW